MLRHTNRTSTQPPQPVIDQSPNTQNFSDATKKKPNYLNQQHRSQTAPRCHRVPPWTVFYSKITPQPRGCENRTRSASIALDQILPTPPISATSPSWLWRTAGYEGCYIGCAKTPILTVRSKRLHSVFLKQRGPSTLSTTRMLNKVARKTLLHQPVLAELPLSMGPGT